MDYATKRIEAQILIKEIIKQEKKISISKLCLIITETKGLGSTFVNKYLKLLEENEMVNISNNEVESV